jgi:hypothetical protein
MLDYNTIEHEVELMARAFNASGKKITQNRIIVGFSVTLDARNQMYYIGCDRYMNESGMKIAVWLYTNQPEASPLVPYVRVYEDGFRSQPEPMTAEDATLLNSIVSTYRLVRA